MTDARPVHISTPAEGVLLVAIDRPHARNAINDEVARLVAEAMDRLDTDDTLRAGILTGNGPGFSAGLDLKAFLDGETGEHPERGFAGLVRRPPRKPLIAAVEGFALAGGLEITLACDLIVAARDAPGHPGGQARARRRRRRAPAPAAATPSQRRRATGPHR